MKQKGFSFLELMVVIAILGIIAAVVALNVGNFFGRGGETPANNITENMTVDRIIIGQVTAIDWQDEYTFLYFHNGLRLAVDSTSFAVAANNTNPLNQTGTYRLHKHGYYFADNPYYTVVGMELAEP